MNLQRFVTEVLETIGGVVIPLEYGLCEVLLPDPYREIFHDRTEYLLAFDFEVAQENPGAEFVTFGSYILDRAIDIVMEHTVSTIRYGISGALTVSNPEQKIRQYLNMNTENIKIISTRKVMGVWAAFCFRIGYVSDERVEEIREIWIDLLTGKCASIMEKKKSSIFYETSPLYHYPLPCALDFPTAFSRAYEEITACIEDRQEAHLQKHELERELYRIEEYYTELEKENQKSLERRGINDERKQTLQKKGQALLLDKQKQRREMIDKYSIKTDTGLDYGILYFIPLLEYRAMITNRNHSQEQVLYYNPILKCFSG